MSSRANATLPVRELRDRITELEAAVLEVLHKPKGKAVHRIRTATRRIEAQLELLDTLALRNPELQALPGRARAERKTRKVLRQLRKAAGKVRDLDVERKLVKQMGGNLTRKQSSHADAEDLGDWLKHRRKEEAHRFRAGLERHRDKFAPRLEAVLDVFGQAEDLRVTEPQLIGATESWFRQRSTQTQSADSVDDRLHGIRKSAKLARYMAESGGDSMHRAHAVGAKFGELQECGGQWHDLLTLAKLARKHLSRKSALARRLTREERRLRERFQEKIANEHLYRV